LSQIECELKEIGISLGYINPPDSEYGWFMDNFKFLEDYHGGPAETVWDEKLFEHFTAYTFLGLDSFGAEDVYIDVAAGGSPWAHMLRDVVNVSAFAINIEV